MKQLFGLSLFLISSFSWAQVKGEMTPFPQEKLPVTTNLTESCSNVSIVEWKSTPGFESSSEMSDKSITVLDRICQRVSKVFPKFIKSRGYSFIDDGNYHVDISLLPARLDRAGDEYRNLNDIDFRFVNRSREYDESGNLYPIWGYFQRARFHVYVRNDVLDDQGKKINPEFRTVFAHELFHSLSYYYGIFEQHHGNKDIVEEKLASNFTLYLGYGI